jgi:hypothetical protein
MVMKLSFFAQPEFC